MMRLLMTTGLTLTMLLGVATADRGNGNRRNNAPAAHNNRNHGKQSTRPAARGDRRRIVRRPVRARRGQFVFANGTIQVYTRPVFTTRYYNRRARPAYVEESYAPVPGYVWVRGSWAWSGVEWRWNSGYYAADPQYRNYYSDGTFDLRVNINLGG